MSLGEHLQQLTEDACTTSPKIVEAFQHVKKYCEAQAVNGKRSCALDLRGHSLSQAQLSALKKETRG